MNDHGLWRGRLALAAAVVIWSVPAIFQFWLARSFDPWTQNFYRYAAGLLAITPFVVWGHLHRLRKVGARELAGCAIAAIPNVSHQVLQTMAVVLLWPGLYALLGRSSVIMTAVLAVIFFADERWIARSVKFQAGTLLGLFGVAGLVWSPGPDGAALSMPGLLLAFGAAASWAAYGILVKKFTVRGGPMLGSWTIGLFTVAYLLPPTIAFGDFGAVLRADAWTNFVLFASGVLSIGIGHWLYYVAIRELGAAPSQSGLLLCPLGTVALSTLIFGEDFRAGQIIAGAALLLGAFLALSARPPARQSA
ncbi:MAG: DMT family transporter [Chthoniobacterales bacterium]|nr:DMT family transporter [Chthoniobacterales bacterium]